MNATGANSTRTPTVISLNNKIVAAGADLDRLFPIFGQHVGKEGRAQKAAFVEYCRVQNAQHALAEKLSRFRARTPAEVRAKAAALAVVLPRKANGEIATRGPDGCCGGPWGHLADSLTRDITRLPG